MRSTCGVEDGIIHKIGHRPQVPEVWPAPHRRVAAMRSTKEAAKPKQGTNAKGRSRKRGKFVALGEGLVTSEAWRALGGSAIRYYIELRRRFNGRNNGELHLSLVEAERLLGMGRHTVMRAQHELVEKGLIQCMQKGGFRQRLATTWALTDEPTGKTPPTHSYKDWRLLRNGDVTVTSQSRARKSISSVPKEHPIGCRNSTQGRPQVPQWVPKQHR